MCLFGPTNKVRGSHLPSSATATPFTFTFTQIQTSDSETAPFLKLPAELRNEIYELAAKQQNRLILFDGRIVLPPLGSVCKKIRTEMRGVFEQEAISNIALSIAALVVNFDFKPLFDWLDEYDQRPGSTYPGQFARILHIRLACQSKLSLSHWFDESSPRCSSLGESLKKQRLQCLLLQNIVATMYGWSWELTRFMSCPFYTNLASPHQRTRFPFFHANARCRRVKTGYQYFVSIIANDTWRCLEDTPSTKSQVSIPQNKSPVWNPDSSTTNFYPKIYEALARDESMRTDVDRRLALAVREACQSRRSRAERDAAAVFTDLSHLRLNLRRHSLPVTLYWKWAFIIYDRAAKELSRLEADLRVEKQKRHELYIAKKAEKAAKDERDRQFMLRRAAEDHEFWRPLRAKVDASMLKDQHDMARGLNKRTKAEDAKPAHRQRASRGGLGSDGTEDEFEELTRLMARWHL